jgi:crotonobetainyl-CoA:carnitine CoA-transferase CaiB-like acyl-CoA transferase
MSTGLPLRGLRVLDLGTVIAGPFAASLLADLGAEVIKIEPPGVPDGLRRMGRIKNDVCLWWGVSARDKKSLSLDLKSEAGKATFRELVAASDVMIENFRPGVLGRLGFEWEELKRLNPRLILLSISGFGQTGPLSARPGFGKIAEGFSGILPLTGPRDNRPYFVGFSLADTSTGMFGAFGVAVALYHRDVLGKGGTRIDLALYEPLFRMLDAQFLSAGINGAAAARRGTNDPQGWGLAVTSRPRFLVLKSRDEKWLFIALPEKRINIGDGSDPALAAFVSERDAAAAAQALRAAGALISPVLDGGTLATNPYLRQRGDVALATDERLGQFTVPAHVHPPVPDDPRHLFRTPQSGEDSEAVLRSVLGFDDGKIAQLRQGGVI